MDTTDIIDKISEKKSFDIFNRQIRLSYTQTIALGFFSLIMFGAFLLCLPVSSRNGEWTHFIDALFTATSATCVTGLVLYDTFTKWAVPGQLVILALIQTGGIGFMTLITLFSIFRKRKIGLHERQMLVQSAGALRLSGVIRIVKRVATCAFISEALGVVLLSMRFCPQMGFLRGVYNAVFHSVSAFCNAGFDLMGRFSQYSSLTGYVEDPVVSLTVIFLIVAGGVGFIVWEDIILHKHRFSKYELHSKIALSATGILVFSSWLLFYMFESDGLLAELDGANKIIAALFQSVTPRTAGFYTIDTAGLSESGSFLTIILMFIGGCSGSTAGGIKTTTLAVLMLGAYASARRSRYVTVFKHRIEGGIVREASAFFMVYMTAVVMVTLVLCAIEPFTLKEVFFEAVSAIGTVGLTMGITPYISVPSKIVLAFLMFIGRVGWMTLVFALAGKYHEPPVKRPAAKVIIG